MIVITIQKAKWVRQRITVNENPSPGTWGNLQLLIEEYKRADDSWIYNNPKAFEKMKFNEAFIADILAEFGELHCEYCGQKDLKMYPWPAKPRKDCATVDHFIPVAKDWQLAFEKSNCYVACMRCNNNKKDHEWPKERIKFPYPNKHKL